MSYYTQIDTESCQAILNVKTITTARENIFWLYYSKSKLISDMPWIAYKMDIKFNEYTRQFKDEKQKSIYIKSPFNTTDPKAEFGFKCILIGNWFDNIKHVLTKLNLQGLEGKHNAFPDVEFHKHLRSS